MKKILLLSALCLCIIVQFAARAQFRQKAEQAFVQELNTVLKGSPLHHWAYSGKMSIDSAFAINTAGILSVTVRYTTGTDFYRVRMEAPVNRIAGIAHDIYVILEYKAKDVHVYEAAENSNGLELRDRRNLFHIGIIEDNGQTIEKLQKLLDALRKYYPGEHQAL
jgi:protein-tyrosine phosphatase